MRQAIASRAAGNEGRARVCARRAAGLGLSMARGGSGRPNAYDLLRHAAVDQTLPESVRLAAVRLSVRVTQAHRLPHGEDPLADARLILEALGFGYGPQEDDGEGVGTHTT
jgi:hypothetical protein